MKLQGGEEFDKIAVGEMSNKPSCDGVGAIIASLVKTYTGKTK